MLNDPSNTRACSAVYVLIFLFFAFFFTAKHAAAQFGASPAMPGPATPASPQFVAAYKQGAMVVFGKPAIPAQLGAGQSTDVGIAALEQTAKHLDALSAAVKAGWTDSTPADQTGRVAGEVEQGVKLYVASQVGTLAADLPGCTVNNPSGTIPTTFEGIFPDKKHYTDLLDNEAVAYRQLEACVTPGSGADRGLSPTTATGSREGDQVLNAVPLVGGIVKGSLKDKANKKQAAAIKDNQGALQSASQINTFALQTEAGSRNLCVIMSIPAEN